MSKEFSIIILIAFTVIILALVCGILFFGITQSKEIANQGHTAINDAVNLSDVILSVQRNGNMPAAAAYTILKENTNLIFRLDCRICNRITTGIEVGDCIKNHLRGRVNLTLTEDASGGVYTAVMTGG